MSAIKFEQVLKRYYGATSEEEGDTFQHWLTKFELVSGIQGWNEEKQREYMPLFFEGPAWDVYESLPAATTATKGALVTAMEAAFSPTKSDAWIQFQARDFREGTDPSTAPSVLAERFVAGLPSSAAEQIRLLAAPEGPISHSKSPRVYVQVQSKLKCVSVLDTGSAVSLVSSETSASMVFSCITLVAGYLALWQLMFLPPLMWHWKDDQPPLNPIYSRLAKYPVKLTAQQEQQYDQELSSWISSGWLIPYDEKKFGPVKVELPFLPVVQAHKSSSPLRACVDARRLNDLVINTPGYSTISCPDKLRQWRIRCALGPFFISLSSGAISRLPVCSISHVFWTLHFASDSYVDDIYVADKALVPKVIEQFRLFGLPCVVITVDKGDGNIVPLGDSRWLVAKRNTAIDDEDGITANVERLPGNDECEDIFLLPRDHGANVDPRGELSSAPSVKDDSSGGGEEDGGSPAQVLASAAVGTDITVFGQQPSVTLSDQLTDLILADINQLDCRDFVDHCSQCAAATTTRRDPIIPITGATAVIGEGPWSIVFDDTIFFNPTADRAEAVLKNNGICVASGLRRAFLRWGPPQVLCMDSGPEMWNSTTRTLFDSYHVKVRRGTPRHPQSQGGVERAHRSLLLILRKAAHYYRCRPTSTTGLSLMLWYQWDVQTWSKMLQNRQARLGDNIDGVLSPESSSVPSSPPQVAFMPGDPVMLLRSERRNKLLPPYERGYRVVEQMAPTMVRLAKPSPRRTVDAHISQVLPDTPQPAQSTDALTRPTSSSPAPVTRNDDDVNHEDDDDYDDNMYVLTSFDHAQNDNVQSPGDVESPR
ncbi:hypothetical protein FOZ60_010202 [Perkinsus olseni]|uniref:Integrase catalytic domain-containing protein n=1 Tax=Perkinsus olseni TaxID=32597 RepID=A0A7J6NFX4_PEROL|nr:hypothetical protein FOZ60_010202 [Perkinsus olseni]